MQDQSTQKMPTWFWIVAILGCAWNIFGVFQFITTLTSTQESFVSMGMTDSQAKTMLALPLWMNIAFAIGTFGGLIGTILLILRKKIAIQIFTASLLGYIILYVGDITEGVFKAIGISQIIILTFVVLISAGLLWVSKILKKNNKLG